ncbi:expressed unknown protein [Seminavis robusta]|uniref:Uncharacterized protein n=1 Tax=Seminavis robusta TaxID=568900 RepID=A0A9N8HBP5_9STRA|nr:expressed unknown protein [Seminavis robusta]|eukprot:Sro190_g081860.1 n/a (312) ;mRNA; r:55204-56139
MKLVNKLVAVACAWNSARVLASDGNLRGSNEVDAIDMSTEGGDKREPWYFQGTMDHLLQNNGTTVVDPVNEDLNFDEGDLNFVAVHPHDEDRKLVVEDTNGPPTNSTSSRQGSSRQGLNGATITIGRTPTTPSTFSNAMGGDSGDNDNDNGSSPDDNDNEEDGPGCIPPSPPAPCPAGQIAKFRPEDCSFFCLSPGSGGDDRDRKLVVGDTTGTPTNSTSSRQGSSQQGSNGATITIGRTPTTTSTISNAMGWDSEDNDNDLDDTDNDEDGPGCIPPSPPAPCSAGQIAKFRPEDCSFFCLSPGSGGNDRN